MDIDYLDDKPNKSKDEIVLSLDRFSIKKTSHGREYIDYPTRIYYILYKQDLEGTRFLVKYEKTPLVPKTMYFTTFSNLIFEDENEITALIRSCERETGFSLSNNHHRIADMGKVMSGKDIVPSDIIFTVDVTGLIEKTIDRKTVHEKLSENIWLPEYDFYNVIETSRCVFLKSIGFHLLFNNNLGE